MGSKLHCWEHDGRRSKRIIEERDNLCRDARHVPPCDGGEMWIPYDLLQHRSVTRLSTRPNVMIQHHHIHHHKLPPLYCAACYCYYSIPSTLKNRLFPLRRRRIVPSISRGKRGTTFPRAREPFVQPQSWLVSFSRFRSPRGLTYSPALRERSFFVPLS